MSDEDGRTPEKPLATAKNPTTKNGPRPKPNHPKTADMVNEAIKNLKERRGSSLQAIKKYMSVNYKVDTVRLAPFVRKYLKAAVEAGMIVRTKGKGASGSFKLAAKTREPELPGPSKAIAPRKFYKPAEKKTAEKPKTKSPKAQKNGAERAPPKKATAKNVKKQAPTTKTEGKVPKNKTKAAKPKMVTTPKKTSKK